jgi:hypothetical protein
MALAISAAPVQLQRQLQLHNDIIITSHHKICVFRLPGAKYPGTIGVGVC